MNKQFIKYYNFLHDPFAGDTHEFSFFAQNRGYVLDKLHSLSTSALALIVGDTGSGKTVLKNIFLAGVNPSSQIININATSNKKLLSELAKTINCEEVRLLKIIAQLAQFKNNTYLIIDDAHNLSLEELQCLIEFSKIVKVIVFAQPLILGHKVFNDSNCDLIKLPPCTDVEVKQYVMQKLQDAGGDANLLNEQQLSRIYLLSKGIFSHINSATKKILQENTGQNNDPHKFKLNKSLVLVLGLLVIIGVSFVVFSPLFKGKTVPTPIIAEVSQSKEEVPILVPEQITPNNLSDEALFDENLSIPEFVESDALESFIPDEEPITEVSTLLPPTEPLKQVTATKPKIYITENSSKPNKTYTSEVKADIPTKVLLDPSKKRSSNVSNSSNTSKVTNVNSDNWYRLQNSKHYCLQIVAGNSEVGIKKLLAEYGAGYNYFKKRVNGKVFYVLTFGNFADRGEATNAINNLPANIQQNKPFVISFANINKDLID